MRAAILTRQQHRDVVVRDVPNVRPGPGQVTIRVEVAGVNFADVLALRGDHGYGPDVPYVPGLEVVGLIEDVGVGVAGLAIGQRVTGYTMGGGFAEVSVAQAGLVVPVPDGVPSAVAAAVPVTLSTAHIVLQDIVRVRAGDRLLVHSAAGGIGLALAALAKCYEPGLLVGTVGSEAKVEYASNGGYDHVFVRGPDLVAEVMAVTGERGVDAVLGALGTDGLAEDMRMAAATGRIIRYGNAPGSPHAPLPLLAELNATNLSISGFSRRALLRQDPARVTAALKSTMAAIANGDVTFPVTEIDGLDALPALLDDMFCGLTYGKAVVRVRR